MDTSLIHILFWSSVPSRIEINEHGVVLNGLLYKISYGNLSVTFKVCFLGAWGGSVSIFGRTWGYSSPLMSKDCRFSTFEECMNHLWEHVRRFSPDKGCSSLMEYSKIVDFYDRWCSLEEHERVKLFNEEGFYDT